MAANYVKLTSNTMSALPVNKQAEVYSFAKYRRERSKKKATKKKKTTSVLDIIGLGESGHSDISINHDTYLYE